jgi:multidrug efflux pump subunit AcrA (membrane-fusion protein)
VSVTGRIIENAVVVPGKAITATPRGDQQVFVVQQGKAVKRSVQTGLEQDGHVQILSGINSGEAVIIEGNLNLKQGTTVNAVAPAAAGGASK